MLTLKTRGDYAIYERCFVRKSRCVNFTRFPYNVGQNEDVYNVELHNAERSLSVNHYG